MQKLRAPLMGALFLLMGVTNVTGMESELKQRLLSSNQNETQVLIEQQILEDCGICWVEKEVKFVPCIEAKKHPKICDTCLDGCNKLCPFCRRDLIVEKSKIEKLCLGIGCGSLVIYVCMIINSFS